MYRVVKGQPLSMLTTFQVGGPAGEVVYVNSSTEDILELEGLLSPETFIIGGGSNVLASDAGFEGRVIKLVGTDAPRRIGPEVVEVPGEARLDEFVEAVISWGLCGVEHLAGIPGSVAGAIVQNAGAYGQVLAETVASVRCLDRTSGTIKELDRMACKFGYRNSLFKSDGKSFVILGARFKLRPAHRTPVLHEEVRSELGLSERLKDAQATPLAISRVVRAIRLRKDHIASSTNRTAGSFFKNYVLPEAELQQLHRVKEIFDARRVRLLGAGQSWIAEWTVAAKDSRTLIAGSLIGSSCDLESDPGQFAPGAQSGQLRFGESGPNTIIAVGRRSTARNIMALASEVRERVWRTYGVLLEPEVILLGDLYLE